LEMLVKKGKKLIIANWKMNPGGADAARELFLATRRAAAGATRRVSVAVCPPAPFLTVLSRLANKTVIIGAQDSFWRNGGHYTGEIAPEMLKDAGAQFVLSGHSERRERGETDDMVSRKTQAVLREGMTAVVCVGEKVRDENGAFFSSLREQIKASFARVQRRFITDVIIAYEPLWAIGKNWREAARPEDVREAAIFIRKTLSDIFGDEGVLVPVLYGGSVGPENAEGLLRGGDIAGFLVGHESLDPEAFAFLIKLANEAKV